MANWAVSRVQCAGASSSLKGSPEIAFETDDQSRIAIIANSRYMAKRPTA